MGTKVDSAAGSVVFSQFIDHIAGRADCTQTATADVTLDPDKDCLVILDGTSASVDATLPTASLRVGHTLLCVAINISNTCQVIGTINGVADHTFTQAYEAILLHYTGTAWVGSVIPPSAATEAMVDVLLAASSIDDDRLKALGTTRLMGGRDIGRLPIGYFYLTGVVSDTELVTINGRTYEFDNDSTSTGDVAVDVTGDLTADAACTALVTAINADASATVEALAMTGNADTNAGVILVGSAVSASNQTLTTSCANGVVSAANTTGAAALTNRDLFFTEYAVTAADVTQLATTGGNSIIVAGVPTTTAPTLLNAFVRTSAGAAKPLVATLSFIVSQVNSNFYAVTVDDSAATLANGDTIGLTLAL